MRALLIVLDSAGVGSAPDAEAHGDRGADTLGHVFAHTPDLALPALFSLGLGEVLAGHTEPGGPAKAGACYGRMRTRAPGKDTISAHWEMAGAAPKLPFAIFDRLPPQLLEAIEAEAKVLFIGNRPGRGAALIGELGEEHLATGRPILYTSAESVVRIAAHEQCMPRKRLYEICRVARRHANAARIARVIARPFAGKPGAFAFTPGRHEYPMVPPRTVLNAISEKGLVVEGVGRVAAIFARSGVTHSHATKSNAEGMRAIERIWDGMHDGLLFANLGDFDNPHGHGRDVAGYARALAEFDAWLGRFLPKIAGDDLLIITADHGNDPTFRGSDHTREEVPLLVRYDRQNGPLGNRETLADIAATLAEFFHLEEKWPPASPFLEFQREKVRAFKQERR